MRCHATHISGLFLNSGEKAQKTIDRARPVLLNHLLSVAIHLPARQQRDRRARCKNHRAGFRQRGVGHRLIDRDSNPGGRHANTAGRGRLRDAAARVSRRSGFVLHPLLFRRTGNPAWPNPSGVFLLECGNPFPLWSAEIHFRYGGAFLATLRKSGDESPQSIFAALVAYWPPPVDFFSEAANHMGVLCGQVR
jgi:hypothetical protein